MANKKADLLRLLLGLALIGAAAGVMIYRNRQQTPQQVTQPADPAAEVVPQPFRSWWEKDGVLMVAGRTMGPIPYSIQVWPGSASRQSAEQAARDAFAALERVNSVMSAYLPDSDLARLNEAAAGQAVTLDPELFELLQLARRHTRRTKGAFDPTARRLFQHWKHLHQTSRLPTETELADMRRHQGWDKVRLDPAARTATKAEGLLQIDLGAVAKGYAVDKVIGVLQAAGMAGGLVEVGGEVRVFGVNPKREYWGLGIRHPFQPPLGHGAYCGKLRVNDRAVATSGNYFRFSDIAGKRYSHIVDPRTGWPVDMVPSVTVIAEDCTTADMWATALSVLGPKGLVKIEADPRLEAAMIVGPKGSAEVVQTRGFAKYLDGPIDPTPVKP